MKSIKNSKYFLLSNKGGDNVDNVLIFCWCNIWRMSPSTSKSVWVWLSAHAWFLFGPVAKCGSVARYRIHWYSIAKCHTTQVRPGITTWSKLRIVVKNVEVDFDTNARFWCLWFQSGSKMRWRCCDSGCRSA